MQENTEFSISGNVLEVDVTGKLTKADLEQFIPAAEKLIKEHAKIRVLFVMNEFQGWTESALQEDIDFDLNHFSDIERIAIVGAKSTQHGCSIFCRPYCTAEVRHLELAEIDEARQWASESP